ncbi:MAG: beta-ketoacyl-ACP synthase II [Myxococcota bacterium]|nr:beta-ketoacyl-ACP synthase II [Myxococcota bacterium]
MKRRVVVTGIGALSPLGLDTNSLWDGLLAGQSGVGPITLFDATNYPVTFAAEVRGFEPEGWVEAKEVKKLDRFIQFALAASAMALEDSGLEITEENADETAVYIGSGIGGLQSLSDAVIQLDARGPRRVSPFVIPKILVNMGAGHVSIATGATGPNFSHVSACATGSHSIGEAFRLIQFGDARAAIAGGSEASVVPLAVAGFARMRALSPRVDEPQRASRPFDAQRDGFVIGEGAGILILEEYESARARGARIYCEIKGYGANSDAYHMTAPAPDGRGATRCMAKTLANAGWNGEDVDYINAHGTSTPFNDAAETKAIKTVFGDHAYNLAVSSTKSMTGHLLGAAGGLEAVICALAIHRGVLPPTINLENPDPECDLDYIPGTARETRVRRVLSNAFGFGGTNACVAFSSLD